MHSMNARKRRHTLQDISCVTASATDQSMISWPQQDVGGIHCHSIAQSPEPVQQRIIQRCIRRQVSSPALLARTSLEAPLLQVAGSHEELLEQETVPSARSLAYHVGVGDRVPNGPWAGEQRLPIASGGSAAGTAAGTTHDACIDRSCSGGSRTCCEPYITAARRSIAGSRPDSFSSNASSPSYSVNASESTRAVTPAKRAADTTLQMQQNVALFEEAETPWSFATAGGFGGGGFCSSA
jgi:hypothetical protein